MHTITARNVNAAVAQALPYLLESGIREESRNGTVIVAPTPVMTTYTNPTERVLYSATRDANPFFHLMEALWMLAGRNDLAFPMYFNKNFSSYSDNGLTVHGAYGHRWRNNFGFDQLPAIAKELHKNPNSRRCVLQIWDATRGDLEAYYGADDLYIAMEGGKDVPCNTQAYFDARGGVLNMTVCCRSNDVMWGAYGANAVHFSILQEYLAAIIGIPVGVYRQFSNNFHVYTEVYDTDKLSKIAVEAEQDNFYVKEERNFFKPHPLISTNIDAWHADLHAFMKDPLHTFLYNDDFFNWVAHPMYMAWYDRKEKRGDGLNHVAAIEAEDWKLACLQWIARRERKH